MKTVERHGCEDSPSSLRNRRSVRKNRLGFISAELGLVLLVVALLAAYTAAQRPAGILYLVAASFSLAAAGLVPAMVLGIFWPGATRSGAIGGMLTGLGVTLYYMVAHMPALRGIYSSATSTLWWGIQPVSAGVFGVPAGVAAVVVLSLLSRTGQQPSSGN